jgi:hypothetical protein
VTRKFCIFQRVNLSPTLINRLTALKSLLDLGDVELVSVAASRLNEHQQEPAICEIQVALRDHRYADAARMIEKLLSDGTRLAQWIDPEIVLLEAEYELLSTELADLESEQAELAHHLSRYQAAFHESLGERLARLLKLRMRKLLRESKSKPEKKSSYKQAKKDFEDFKKEQETRREMGARTEWKLSEEEQKELKRLFRQGSKLCHPDLVAAEHKEPAARMFMELRKAYDEGDLLRIRHLVERCEAGLFDSTQSDSDQSERKKQRLRAQIAGIREALDRVRQDIQTIQESNTYQVMTQQPDWEALFAQQAELLDQEIEHLSEELARDNEDGI